MSRFFPNRVMATLICGLLAGAAPAQAGFEWNPPPAPPVEAAPPVPARPAMPVDSVALMETTPAVTTPDPLADGPDSFDADPLERAPFMMDEPRLNPRLNTNMDASATTMQNPAHPAPVRKEKLAADHFMKAAPTPTSAPAPVPAAHHDFPDAVGFGRDIPLALALQQIVPAGFAFAFGDGVNPGQRVSWDGGQPWNIVLEETVRPYGLAVVIDGSHVYLKRGAPQLPAAMPVMTETETPQNPFADMPAPAGEAYAAPQPMTPEMQQPQPAQPAQPAQDPFATINDAAPVPFIPARAAVPGYGDEWRPVYDWQAEENYTPSYPRRDPAAARERMIEQQRPATGYEESPFYKEAPARTAGPQAMVPPQDHAVTAPAGIEPAAGPIPLMRDDDMVPMAEPAGFMPRAPQNTGQATGQAGGQDIAHAGRHYSQLTGLSGAMAQPLDPLEIGYWQAEAGESLRAVMTRWATQAGAQLFWAEGRDYQLPAAVQTHGTFADVVQTILKFYEEAPQQPVGRLHPNDPAGPAVLIIDHRA